MPRKQIGLFGGTFDPPHIVHLILASEAAYQFNLSRLLWVLTPDPPHKQGQSITPLAHRLEMTQRVIAADPLFELSKMELERPGPHYTIDTVKLLAAQEPNADIVLLLGGDSLRDLPTWHQPAQLITAVHKIGVMRRPENSFDLGTLEAQLPGLSQKVTFSDTLLQNLSSSEIRRRAAGAEPYRYYVHPAVFDYIESNQLYRKR
ncbi:MAG: nicotinate-nucleotide adenylyltransferase [bacterium]